jgi:RNA polymerase sigma factor (sigma-70 family)
MRLVSPGAGLQNYLDVEDALPPDDYRRAPPSLETLYERNAKRLLRFFSRRTHPDDAADLVHDTFARFAGLDECRRAEVEEHDAYLSRVATNVLRDRARSAARRAIDASIGQSSPVDTVDPHSLLEDRDALRRLEQAVDALPSRRRRIFLLHRLENLTYAEIAAEVGMSEKGVKKQMAKALFALRNVLAPE